MAISSSGASADYPAITASLRSGASADHPAITASLRSSASADHPAITASLRSSASADYPLLPRRGLIAEVAFEDLAAGVARQRIGHDGHDCRHLELGDPFGEELLER